MGRVLNTVNGLMPAMLMVAYQAAFTGVNIFYKLAGNVGMSLRVLIAYRFLFAAAFIVPLALVVERKSRPRLTWVVIGQGFLCGLLGASLAQNLYAESLVLTSATFVAAMTNVVPAMTFVLALAFRMENLQFGTWAGKAKLVGTMLCVGGAMLLTFYKGPEIYLWSTNVNLLHKGGHVAVSHQKAPLLGALLILCSCLAAALQYIIQAKMIRNYPCPCSSTAIMITFGAIQATGFALCVEKDWSQWRLGWDFKLLTVSYTGIFASGAMFIVTAWCVQVRGPLFVSVFSPLMLVLVAIAGSLVLDEKLHLGTVLGAVVIVCGLYTVLWGKSKELKRITQHVGSSWESEIIISSSTESSSSGNNILVPISNNISMEEEEDEIQE